MAKESKSKRDRTPQAPANKQATQSADEARSGRIWIREDGAVCIDNECIVIQSSKDGAADITVNPSKCSCEAGESVYQTILKAALTGKGSRITITPKED